LKYRREETEKTIANPELMIVSDDIRVPVSGLDGDYGHG
jgi:hypothetical protein